MVRSGLLFLYVLCFGLISDFFVCMYNMAESTSTSFIYVMRKEELQKYLLEAEQSFEADDTVSTLRAIAVKYVRGLGDGVSTALPPKESQVSATRENLFLKALEPIPALHGTEIEQVLSFIIATDRLSDMALVSDIFFLQCLITKVSGLILDTLSETLQTMPSYEAFKTRILEYACPARVLEHCKSVYVKRFQTPNESFPAFVQSIVNYHRALNLKFKEIDLVQMILENANPVTKHHLPRSETPTTLKELRACTVKVENNLRVTADYLRMYSPVNPSKCQLMQASDDSVAVGIGNFSRKVSLNQANDVRQTTIRCSNCTGFGHKAVLCPNQFVPYHSRLCFKCMQPGHVSLNCTKRFNQGNF